MRMTRIFCALVALVLAACAANPLEATAPRLTREQCIAELVRIAGIEAVLDRAQAQAAADARRYVDRSVGQLGDLLAKLPADRREKLSAAIDRLMASATAPPDMADAAAAWGRFYSANLSDEELRQAVAYARTPLGRKQLQAGAAASDQLRTYLHEKRAPLMEKATAQYIADLRGIISGPRDAPSPPGASPP